MWGGVANTGKNTAYSPLNNIVCKIDWLRNFKNPIKNTKKKPDEKKNVLKVILEIRDNYRKSIELKNRLRNVVDLAKADEVELLKLLRAKKRHLPKIIALLDKYGISYDTESHFPLNKIERRLIRADYCGSISPVESENDLSGFYKECRDGNNFCQYDYKDYSLRESKAWEVFAQFKNFRVLETCVKKHLYRMSVPPNKVKKLMLEDFMDILHKEQVSKKKPLFLGMRRSFIKDFIKKAEPQFRAILDDLGVDKRYTNALVKSMKTKGLCENIKVYDLLGRQIKGPTFSVHHKTAVQDGFSKNYLAEVNLFKNLCFTINEPYHSKILHRLDRTYIDDDGNILQKRMNFKNKNIVFMGGFSQLHQIFFDYNKDERTKRASEKISKAKRVNIKMNGKPQSDVITSYEKRMRKKGKEPINYRVLMKIRDRS